MYALDCKAAAAAVFSCTVYYQADAATSARLQVYRGCLMTDLW
jgi:hypothetical protein